MSKTSQSIFLNQEELVRIIDKAYVNYNKSPKSRKTVSYIQTRLEILEKNWVHFTENHTQLTGLLKKDEREMNYFTKDVFDSTEDIYTDYKTKMKEDLAATSSASASTTQIQATTSKMDEIRIPEINLTKFSGDYTEWQAFHDLFVSVIDKNTRLSPVQKLHYLKGCLLGDAAEVVNNYSITDANYEEVWLELNRLYTNKRYNANEVLQKLFNQKIVPSGSSNEIKQLLNTTCKCLKGFSTLGIDTNSWDVIIIYIVTTKLDHETRSQWEMNLTNSGTNDLPKFDDLKSFLENKYRTMEILHGSARPTTSKAKPFHTTEIPERKVISCAMCKEEHHIHVCKQFFGYTPKERTQFVQSQKLCYNCLMPNHAVKKCKHPISCKKCGRRHHTMLHLHNENRGTPKESLDNTHVDNQRSKETPIVTTFSRNFSPCDVLLATAVVRATSLNGVNYVIRALVDQGSQASFITESTVQILDLKRTPVNGWVSGVGDGQTRVRYVVSLRIQSRHQPNNTISVNAFVVSSLTSMLPSKVVHTPDWSELQSLSLADPDFTTPGKIEVLLGAEVFSEIILSGVIKNPARNLIAQNTVFGWIISGKLSRNTATDKEDRLISMHTQVTNSDDLSKKFYELEKEPEMTKKQLTTVEIRESRRRQIHCESTFYKRKYSGLRFA